MKHTLFVALCLPLLSQAVAVGAVAAAPERDPSPSATSSPPDAATQSDWRMGGFLDATYIKDFNAPPNHLFRNRGTTPRVDEFDLNMAAAYVRKAPSNASRWGVELTGQAGQDTKTFGFSPTAPNVAGADWLLHLGPTNVSYIVPAGAGLTVQGGIFGSLIGYDSLYAKDNFAYTRPWGADYTPYLMLGVNVSYPLTEAVTGTVAVVNGYWHLAHANDVPSFVGQVAAKASDHVTFKQTVLYGPHQSDTSLEFWRVLSDSILERKSDRLTVAVEYQLGAERVDTIEKPLALWMSAQLPLHWVVRRPWSVTFRPEAAWDRDGRWIGAPQSVAAFTSTLEYRLSYRQAQTILRFEHRIDNSRGSGGGFFTEVDAAHPAGLTPKQNLLMVAAIISFEMSPDE